MIINDVRFSNWGKGELSINSSCIDKSSENICSNNGGAQEEEDFQPPVP